MEKSEISNQIYFILNSVNNKRRENMRTVYSEKKLFFERFFIM